MYLNGECFYDFPSPKRVFEHGYSIDGLEDLTLEKCIDICESVEGTDLILYVYFICLKSLNPHWQILENSSMISSEVSVFRVMSRFTGKLVSETVLLEKSSM